MGFWSRIFGRPPAEPVEPVEPVKPITPPRHHKPTQPATPPPVKVSRQKASSLSLLADLPDPFEGFTGVEASELEPVRQVLRRGTGHHFPVCQALASILEGRDWAWPGAEKALDPRSTEPINDLAAAMWISWNTREAAVSAIKRYLESEAQLSGTAHLLVDVLPADECPVCAAQVGPMSISKRIKAGLPPFHGGCRCTLIPVVKRG